MELIVTAISALGASVVNLLAAGKQAKYGRLPDWMTPKDFQRENYTMEIILSGLALAFLAIIISAAIILARKK